ncbi:MAG: LL-diaminopimelate aminotransferase [Anaerolineae bacterium]|nr:LL-diaminopimelate aminotransferase [Anaerolineae bacterium]
MNNNRWASQRAQNMPVSMFNTMDAAKVAAQRKGLEIIDLSVGSSDLPAPPAAMEALREATRHAETHGYCLHSGTQALRQAAAGWFEERYGGNLDPDHNVLVLVGSQEGFAHLLLALTDPGDMILAPDPGYPSYFGAIALAGLELASLPLLEENGFLPDLNAVPSEVARQARVMALAYPNNPTAAVASAGFFREVIDFCRDNDIFLIHDFPYVDMVYGDYEAPSVLAQPGGIDIAVELYSCSKSYHMGGFRIGWAAGNPAAIAALAQVKSAIDFNQYPGIQQAAIAAINQPRAETRRAARIFETRRNMLVKALNNAGWQTPLPQASMYVWTRLPAGLTNSFDFTVNLAGETGVCLAPGRGFGERGEGFVRFALVREPEALERAVKRIRNFLGGF